MFSHVQSCRQRHASCSQTPFKMIFWDNSHCFCCQSPTLNLQPWSHGMALSSTQLLLWTGGRDVLCRIDAQKDPNQNSGLKKLCGKVKCKTSILAQIGVWLGRWDGDTTCPLLGVVLFPKQVYFLPGFQRSKNCSGLRHFPYAALHFFKFLRGGWGPLLHKQSWGKFWFWIFFWIDVPKQLTTAMAAMTQRNCGGNSHVFFFILPGFGSHQSHLQQASKWVRVSSLGLGYGGADDCSVALLGGTSWCLHARGEGSLLCWASGLSWAVLFVWTFLMVGWWALLVTVPHFLLVQDFVVGLNENLGWASRVIPWKAGFCS